LAVVLQRLFTCTHPSEVLSQKKDVSGLGLTAPGYHEAVRSSRGGSWRIRLATHGGTDATARALRLRGPTCRQLRNRPATYDKHTAKTVSSKDMAYE